MAKPEGERIAVLENETETHGTQIEKLTAAVEGISDQLHQIALQIAKSKGFVAGVSFSFSMLGAGLVCLIDHLWFHR